jgi:MFS transporter, YNFM family, putative membrane transport protein
MSATVLPAPLEAGTPAFRNANLGLFVGGFATFALLYGPQPLLPLLCAHFGVTPATASLAISVTTGALALMLIPLSLVSDRYGRTTLMKWSLAGSSFFSLLIPFAQTFEQLLVLRALVGICIAGLPAAAMAWLGEEISPRAQGRAMGLYIGGNALGGMSGRFLAAFVTEWSTWHAAFALTAAIAVAAAFVFWRSMPDSQHFKPRPVYPRALYIDLVRIYGDRGLPWLFTAAFMLMGAFVGLYNYLGFRLVAPPYSLGQTAVGSIFLLYLVGTWASAWSGRLGDRFGRRNVLWVMGATMGIGLVATLAASLPLIIAGVALFTFGFFGAHTTASGWVGQRAHERRALASGIYLSSYYLGASVPASLAGLAWSRAGWPGVVLLLGTCVTILCLISLHLRRLP